MEEFVYYGELFNTYKFLLTDNQQKVFSMYYEDNLSLQEISEVLNVSKSYVGKSISEIKKKLDYLEDNLKVISNNKKLNELLEIDSLEIIKKEIEKLI